MSLFMLSAPMSPIAVLAGFVAGGAVGAGACRAALRKRFAGRHPRADRCQSTARSCPPLNVLQPSERGDWALEGVNPFIDRLAELRLSEWLAIGRVALEDRDVGRASRSTSRAILDAIIAHQHLDIVAWYVRDAVDTVGFLARQAAPSLTRADQRIFDAAQAAAQEAALAVVVRESLPMADFQTMCAPFDVLTPDEQAS
jgi:hypothetical protein